MALMISGAVNTDPEASDIRISLEVAGIISSNESAKDIATLITQLLTRPLTQDPLRANLQLRLFPSLQSYFYAHTKNSPGNPVTASSKHASTANISPPVRSIAPHLPIESRINPMRLRNDEIELIQATPEQLQVLEVIATEQIGTMRSVSGRFIRSRLWAIPPETVNKVLDSCIPTLLKIAGERPQETYKLQLLGILNTSHTGAASRIIEGLLRFLRFQEQEEPSFTAFTWDHVKTYLHLEPSDFQLVATTIDIADLHNGGRPGSPSSQDFSLNVPSDIERVLRCATLPELLNLRHPALQIRTAITPMASSSSDIPTLDALMKFKVNKDEFRQLQKQVKDRRFTPFVGAGMSIPCGLPGWTDFLLNEAEQAGIKSIIQGHISKGQYEEAAQALEDELLSFAFNRRIFTLFGADVTPRGAVTLLPKLTSGPIITTNFDRILEAVFQEANPPLTPVWGARLGAVRDALFADGRYIIKIHGDARDETDRVLTKSEYDKHYGGTHGQSQPLPYALRRIFTSSSLLFLGCSLGTDRTIPILKDIAGEAAMPAHYAIIEAPEALEDFRNRRRQLTTMGIVPIWYPQGKHGAIEVFLQALVS